MINIILNWRYWVLLTLALVTTIFGLIAFGDCRIAISTIELVSIRFCAFVLMLTSGVSILFLLEKWNSEGVIPEVANSIHNVLKTKI